MARTSQAQTPRKPARVGPRKQATAEWKERVRRRLDERGLDHRWLEAHIVRPDGRPVSRGSVTKLLAAGDHTSMLVDPICELLDLAAPVVETSDPEELELLAGFRRMPADQRRFVLGMFALGVDAKKN